jgi:hypothetical protein
MTKTDLDELEQKYLPWKDTHTAQQILRLITEYRQPEKQLAINNLSAPDSYQACLEADNWDEEQMGALCQNYPPAISEEQLAQMQEFARQQHLLDIQQRGPRREKRAARKVEQQQGKILIKAGAQNMELFEDEQ